MASPAWLLKGAGSVSNIIEQIVPRSGQAIKGSYGQIVNAGKQASSDTFLNSLGNTMLGGIRDAAGTIARGGSLSGAIRSGFYGPSGKQLMWNRAIGGGSMLAIGWRFATGGGIYRDKNGNFDVAGVPFI